MARISVFLASVGVVLAAVGALDWWIDPFQDRYDSAPLAAALARGKPCFLAWDVFGTRAWPALKLDLFRRRDARVVVIGTSRAGKIEARPGERRFANLVLPGVGPESLAPLFRILHSQGHGRLVVYLATEPFWFGRGWRTRTTFTHSYLRNVKYLLSSQTFRATYEELRHTPGVIRHPHALRPWDVYHGHGACVVDRGDSVFRGASHAWAPDGGLWYNDEITGAPKPHGVPIVALEYGGFVGHGLDSGRRAAVEDALRTARSYGWRLVGVALPFSTYWRLKVERDPRTDDVMRAFRREMPGIFARYGFRFIDLTNVRSVPCDENSFSLHDGGHPDLACGRKIRRLLDTEARRSAPRP